MIVAIRILAILLVTLGFQIHGFVGAVAASTTDECVVMVSADRDGDTAAALADKPSPSCKAIGAGGSAAGFPAAPSISAIPLARGDRGPTPFSPSGPEKPPKAG